MRPSLPRLFRGIQPRTPSSNLTKAQRRGRTRVKLLLEALEDRLAPAGIFDGGGDGTSFDDALNWDNDVVPDDLVDVVIGDGYDVTSDANQSINSLNLAATSSLTITGGDVHDCDRFDHCRVT